MVFKRKLRTGKITWAYRFDLPGSSRAERLFAYEGGFSTKKQATDAESIRRTEIAAAPKAGKKTLAGLLEQWYEDQKKSWSPKTAQRYAELAAYLSPELTALRISEVTTLKLHQEWERLAESGGHTRKDKTPRPLSAKTVRNIAGTVSSAFSWGILYGLASVNPVTKSKPPQGPKKRGVALSPAQADLVIQSASGPWCLGPFLEICAALGCRRGEALALRWSDIVDNVAHISRSLCQVKGELIWKGTKSGRERKIEIPDSALKVLESHRAAQQEYRNHFGIDYRTDLDLIFALPTGEPLRPDSVSSAVSLLFRRLKLPKGASLHSLRHSHGSQLVAAGVPIPEVAERLGHSSPATTLSVYSHAVPGRGEAAKKWDAYQRKTERPGKDVQ